MQGIRSFLLILMFVVALSAVGYCASSRHMPEGAFLTQPVTNVQDLVNLIDNDDVVAARYTKHFGMSKEALMDYLLANTRVVTVDKPTSYNVYYVTGSGRFVSHYKTLYPGEKMVITHAGVPIMDLRCGNPLSKRLPVVQTKKPEPAPIVAIEPSLTELPVVQPEVAAVEPVVTAVLWEPPIEFVAQPITNTIVTAVVPAILGVGLLSNPSSPVPEPGSLMLLGIGAMGILSTYYRKRFRS